MKADRTPNRETLQSASATRPAAYAWASASPALIAVLLGALALLPRVLGLADFITTDEAYHWIGRAERPIFRPKDQIETVPGIRQAAFSDEPADGCGKVLRREAERAQRLLSGKVGAAARKLLIQVMVE